MKLHKFFVQAKWYADAEKELDLLIKAVPDSKERVDKAREALRELQAEELLKQADRGVAAGQIRLAQALVQAIPQSGLGNVTVKVNTARVKFQNLEKQWAQAERYLRALSEEVRGPNAEILSEAAGEIRDDLYVEGLDRLEPFINLAEQDERAKKDGRIQAQKSEELLALAITGWLLGKESAEPKPDAARKLWKARDFILAYQRSHNIQMRRKMLEMYQKDEPVEIEELARIIAMSPPPDADSMTAPTMTERQTNIPNANRAPVSYTLQLPLEYRHGRPYPLLVVLHGGSERAPQIAERYSYWAKLNGFILASVDWSGVNSTNYEYTADEHQRVLDAIRDVRLHYHVDCDRIFLSGFAEGANAACDIGLSHPDMFAGVSLISCMPKMGMMLPMWGNAKYLPFYMVTGDMAGDAPKNNQRLVSEWITKGFPAMHVLYRGRGTEWFPGEIPNIFEWMMRKVRSKGYPDLGTYPVGMEGAEAFQTMRNEDNRFYWVTAEKINEKYLYENRGKGNAVVPARIQATIMPGNQIRLYTVGIKEASLWFAPGMIDFTKPLSISYRGTVRERTQTIKTPLKPDLTTMMEDFYIRGDPLRLFVTQLQITPEK
jgi:hypothetical protein